MKKIFILIMIVFLLAGCSSESQTSSSSGNSTTAAEDLQDVANDLKETGEEIKDAYEKNTGLVIAETFKNRDIDPNAVPAVLVCKHGPFSWGPTPEKAVENALVLDECAHMALITEQYNPEVKPAEQNILNKHYYRKHGAGAYYGQK